MRLPELIVLAALTAPCVTVHGLQLVEGRDGVAIEAILSIKEPTRIRIEGAPITDVFGNVYSSSCGASAPVAATGGASTSPPGSPTLLSAVNPTGEVVLECDRDKGEIYVRPVSESGKPVNLFISSAQATYTLVLRRADTPADTIVIRDRWATASTPSGSSGSNVAASPLGASAHHVRALKMLLSAMAAGRAPPNVRIEELNQPIQLWAESRFSLVRRYESRDLVGERYQLTNASDKTMVLAEQEFDRPDSADGAQVLGVAIEHHNLRPGETTSVYVIRRGGIR